MVTPSDKVRRRPSRHPSDPGSRTLSLASRRRATPPWRSPDGPPARPVRRIRSRPVPRPPDPSSRPLVPAQDGGKSLDQLKELVDASVKFTNVLKRKGVSQATLQVAVRSRPLTRKERSAGARTITRNVDDRCVVVLDPDEDERAGEPGRPKASKSKVVAGGVRKKERRYVFDAAYDGEATNEQVYAGTVLPHIAGVLRGTNATVFAYGATGSGKTHTMVGDATDPGLMVLSLRDIFRFIARDRVDTDYDVECSYTEVYNELVYDLLVPNSGALELREDPERGPMVAGLTHVKVSDESQIFELLRQGNARRKTEETGANAVSSRSHAVLEIWVTRSSRNHYNRAYTTAKLALVDLAGAERASETNNRGQQLRDGANINKSLLSLANCINALGKRNKKGFVFVPFRDSKLTRILKDGLCGNSRTVMVATVSGSSHQYEHTVNTLKYADRAKEIKTHVQENRGTVETHIAEYQRMIDALQEERRELRAEVERLKSEPAQPNHSRQGSAGGQGHAFPEVMAAEDVERFASELAEATDACARAQRVLLECHFDDDVDAGRAAADCGQAAKALEALAPVEGKTGAAAADGKTGGGSSLFGALFGGGGGGGSRGVPVPDPASQMPVSASDLAALHARAAMAVAADYDAAALDARDKLIEDQRATIRALVGALETRGGIREADVDGIPSGCTVAELESRHDALTRAAVGARGAAGASSRSKAPIIRRGSVGGRAGSPDSDASDRSDASRGAAVLPIRDIRVEAEALAARARAADTASRAGTPERGVRNGNGNGNGNGGRVRRLSAGGMLDQLEYASDALEQTLRTAESSSSDEWSPKSRDEPSARSKGPLSPVPEREAANRGNVAKGRAEYNAWAAKHAQSQTQSRGDASGKAGGVKPSPYAASALAAGTKAKKSSALARRLSRIRG